MPFDTLLSSDSSADGKILVWPRDLGGADRREVLAYAKQHGFAVVRGGKANELTTANVLIRLKGASPTYKGAYEPGPNRKGVPCYFGTAQKPAHAGKRWSAVTGDKFAASPSNLGSAAPQGVSGGTDDLLNGSLLDKLRTHIASSGGSYTDR